MSDLIPTLIRHTGLAENDVRTIISNAPKRYKEYPIPKRTEGVRWIAHPARELKAIQRALIAEYLSNLPIHSAAMAYRTGRSIRDNAVAHIENGPILKFDFSQFFPSIHVRDWYAFCDDRGLFPDRVERYQVGQLLFHQPKGSALMQLAIGAPTSPILSNLLMFEFDSLISEIVQRDFVTYTRYADDLTFSAKRTGYLTGVERAVRHVIKVVRWPRLILNEEKTVLATKKYHRQVTGLVLSNQGKVSLGRDRKRRISAAVHHALRGRLDLQAAAKLAGMLAFAHAVEPDFLKSLERKYGREILDRLKSAPMSLPPI